MNRLRRPSVKNERRRYDAAVKRLAMAVEDHPLEYGGSIWRRDGDGLGRGRVGARGGAFKGVVILREAEHKGGGEGAGYGEDC